MHVVGLWASLTRRPGTLPFSNIQIGPPSGVTSNQILHLEQPLDKHSVSARDFDPGSTEDIFNWSTISAFIEVLFFSAPGLHQFQMNSKCICSMVCLLMWVTCQQFQHFFLRLASCVHSRTKLQYSLQEECLKHHSFRSTCGCKFTFHERRNPKFSLAVEYTFCTVQEFQTFFFPYTFRLLKTKS